MWLNIARWTILALIFSLAGCASSPERGKSPQTGNVVSQAPLSCSFAGFSSDDDRSCNSVDTAQGSAKGSVAASSEPVHLTIQTTSADAREKCNQLSSYTSPQSGSRWIVNIESSNPDDDACTIRLPSLSDVPVPFWPIIEKILLLAIGTSPADAGELINLMMTVLDEMRARLDEADKA